MDYSNVNLKVSVVENTVFYIRYKICPLTYKTNFKTQMQYNGTFRTIASKHECNSMASFEPSSQNMNAMQWHLFKQPPISKARHK